MRRIQRGPVRGISFKLQEEERERKDNYVPDVSAIEVDTIVVDVETNNMLKAMDMGDIRGITVNQNIGSKPHTQRAPRPPRDAAAPAPAAH
jgi:small subunit ribosomal protein S17e